MVNPLFENHLLKTAFRTAKFSATDAPLSEQCDVHQTIAILKAFAESVSEFEELSDTMERFAIANGFSPADLSYLEDVLIESTQRAFNINEADDESTRSFLALLHKPFPKAETRYPNAPGSGMEPNAGEGAIRKMLRQHPINAYPQPFGTKAYDAATYKQANKMPHYGPDKNVGFNAQKPSRPLANYIQNVNQTSNEAFVAIDSQGMGMPHQYRVLNTIRNEWVSPQIHMRDALVMAQELNAELDVLAEQQKNQTVEEALRSESIQNPNSSGQGWDASHAEHALHATCVKHGWHYSHSTPIHQRNGDVLIHHTYARKEHKVGFYHKDTDWQSKVSSASGHSTHGSGAAELDKHLKGKVSRHKDLKEGQEIPSTPITENLLQPMSPVAQAALRHLESSHLKNGSASSFGDTNTGITAMQDFKAKENLLMEARKRENPLPSEEDAIRAQSVKNMHSRKR